MAVAVALARCSFAAIFARSARPPLDLVQPSLFPSAISSFPRIAAALLLLLFLAAGPTHPSPTSPKQWRWRECVRCTDGSRCRRFRAAAVEALGAAACFVFKLIILGLTRWARGRENENHSAKPGERQT